MLLRWSKFVLRNRLMNFDREYFQQIFGIIMGTNLAPLLANIYMDMNCASNACWILTHRHWERSIAEQSTAQHHTNTKLNGTLLSQSDITLVFERSLNLFFRSVHTNTVISCYACTCLCALTSTKRIFFLSFWPQIALVLCHLGLLRKNFRVT